MDYNSSVRSRRPARNNNTYTDYNNDEFDEENARLNQRYYQLDNTNHNNNNNNYNNNNNNNDDEDDDDVDVDVDDDDDDEEDDDDENEYRQGYYRVSRGGIETGESSRRHQKKRRLDNIIGSNYEYAPRVTDRSSDEWSDNATFVLVEVWGERYLQLGRRSLRGEDWVEVAEKVSEMCKMEIDETQCRNRFEGLKNKYKKEKGKVVDMGGREGYNGKWGFFKKMDMLLSPKKQHNGLPCGVDSGEYVFMNSKVYLDKSNALDEMRDSPGESESDDDDDDDDGLDFGKDDEEGFRLLAESVQNFGEIYEKIEGRKRQQTMELEKMRMDFQRDLELQKKQILERAQAEIAKIREGDDEDVNSVENLSG